VDHIDPVVVIGNGDRRLTLSEYRGGVCTVALDIPGIHVIDRLGFGEHGSGGSEDGLCEVFERMTADWRGWSGDLLWNGTADTMQLVFSHDGIGHVVADTTFAMPGTEGYVRTTITLEPGQLGRIATELRALFDSSSD